MSNIVIVGEISDVLRAQGNPLATGISIDGTANSPIVDDQYSYVPQVNIGIMTMDQFNENVASYTQAEDNTTKNPWNSVGAVGLDAIFTPYSTHASSVRSPFLPHFTDPSGTTTGPTSRTLNPFNPFYSLSGLSRSYNTLANDSWMDSGHNISFALSYNPHDAGYTEYPDGNGSPTNIFFEKDHFARHTVETSGIRGVGLRSPMILSGWGYDTNGSPVPSSGGRIHPEAAWNPAVWKSGPVDLRWDESRGVWAAGTSTPRIRFMILSTSFTVGLGAVGCDHVVAIVTHVSCGGAGVSVGDEVMIYDPEYCHFNLPLSVLVGLSGTATMMSSENYQAGLESIVDCIEDVRAEGCIWMIDTLCCAEEETLYE